MLVFLIQLIAGKNKKRELLKFLLALLVVVASLGTFMYAALTVEMPKSDTIVAVMDKINDNDDYQKYGIEANQLTTSMINEWGASGDISPEKGQEIINNKYPEAKFHYEGIAWYANNTPTETTTPLYRFYSSKNAVHFYTISEQEKQYIITTYPTDIWNYEGIAWYGVR